MLGFMWHLALLMMGTKQCVSSAPPRVTKDSVSWVLLPELRLMLHLVQLLRVDPGAERGVCQWLESQGRAGSRGKSR